MQRNTIEEADRRACQCPFFPLVICMSIIGSSAHNFFHGDYVVN